MANEGQELITKMDEARLLARRIHLLATNAGGIDMDVQAEIAKLANQIDRLLHS
jgi:hypothetical protein